MSEQATVQAPAEDAGERRTAQIASQLSAIGERHARLLAEIGDYLTPFRSGQVRSRTTATTAYAATHPDEGFADTDTFQLQSLTRRVDLAVFGTQSAILQWDNGGGMFEGGAEYPAPGFYYLPASLRRVRLKTADATAAQQARYCLTFWC